MPLGLETVTRAVFKRARRGLYAGKKILTGNNISEDGGNRCAGLTAQTPGAATRARSGAAQAALLPARATLLPPHAGRGECGFPMCTTSRCSATS